MEVNEMRKIIGISILLVTVTLMSFAGSLGTNHRGVLAGEAQEIAGLEREYQFFAMLNYIGFTQEQLEQIITAAEKAKDSILSIESEVKSYLESAVELVKTGDVEKAGKKHEAAMDSAKEVIEVRQTYMDTLKGIITVEQQERFMKHLSTTMSKGMDRAKETVVDSERFKQLPEAAKERLEQMGMALRNSKEKGKFSRAPQMRVQPNVRGMMKQNNYTSFFNMLLIDDNLDLMKEYLDSFALQNPAE
jgi:Spy/CpxP family protein refolding chaperone